ncbi:ankyrin repeat-containing domain protein [Lasiosphaeris hirsuta]|uniref:Ankyrin repeat-containing domain protein n=1 Tax=Lasiosphaeris hirsuta TaxID=260670 RepID=A0AA40A9Y9_9PEZI|nr:ankyrin repeat-containing domain protein [Lasiosphaeris hirsuta]
MDDCLNAYAQANINIDFDFLKKKLGLPEGHPRAHDAAQRAGEQAFPVNPKAYVFSTERLGRDGREAEAADIFGWTPLHYACLAHPDDGFQPFVEIADEKTISELLGRNHKLAAKDQNGRTPLHIAILSRRTNIAISLLRGFNGKAPAKFGAKDKLGRTPSMFAVQNNPAKVVGVILDLDKASINQADSEGRTALQYAAFCGEQSIRHKIVSPALKPVLATFIDSLAKSGYFLAIKGNASMRFDLHACMMSELPLMSLGLPLTISRSSR